MSGRKKLLRVTELILLFIALPLIYYLDWLPFPKIATLLGVTAGCVLILKKDSSFDLRDRLRLQAYHFDWNEILIRSAVVAIVIFLLVILVQPETLFFLPKELPWIWVFILLLYPVFSALPQEFIYRMFFFERYKAIFGEEKYLILLSSLSFAFLHIIYDNWWAVVLSFIGGLIFSWTYQKSRSLWWVSLEHAIYGCLLFTIGMGNYFYESI